MSYGGVIVNRQVYHWHSVHSDGRVDTPEPILRWRMDALRAVDQGKPLPPPPEGFVVEPLQGQRQAPGGQISFLSEQAALNTP